MNPVPGLAGRCWFALLVLLPWAGAGLAAGAVPGVGPLKTRHVFLITYDGLRWQEVFRGAEEALMTKAHGGVRDEAALRRDFWRDTPEARRAALLPFLWSTVVQQGQVWGHTNLGSIAKVSNPHCFSYPGYSELLTGLVDPAIDSNKKIPNANTNVIEWVHGRPGFQGRTAVFASWDVFPSILNRQRSGVFISAAQEPVAVSPTPRQELINTLLQGTTPPWDGVRHDSFTYAAAREHLLEHRPRLMYLAFDETDDWQHDGRYDRTLQIARRTDGWIAALWELVQSLPEYRDQTTFVITTDHGRGSGLKAWRDHGAKVEGAEYIWLGILGPDTPALGERRNTPLLWQKQVAATVALLLGEDFRATVPAAAEPMRALIGR
ncbi:MAG: hypothetical protein RJA22_2402 [Verrucomicrobiota bacterium]